MDDFKIPCGLCRRVLDSKNYLFITQPLYDFNVNADFEAETSDSS